ncbi:hypothetical protein FVE85_5100 [Porphyridium purpureum]|uniref:Uncharacterized protein n=1 Tax=Porphyridium purpureum TaxID=35688 RepID=A0A5J4Z2I7_PORPP|nr:hypothetical protein FVE85_5100 [Porphyridium purpureum]|eukprot:POR1104..scf295_1
MLWYMDLGPKPQQFEGFLGMLMEQCCPGTAYYQACDELAARVLDSRSIQEYEATFSALMLRLPRLTEDEKMDKFKCGLATQIRAFMQLAEPKRLRETIRQAVNTDVALHPERARTASAVSMRCHFRRGHIACECTATAVHSMEVEDSDLELNVLEDRHSDTKMGPGDGHAWFASFWTLYHITAPVVPSTGPSGRMGNDRYTVGHRGTQNGLLRTIAMVNRCMVYAIVDSGASHTFISAETAARCGTIPIKKGSGKPRLAHSDEMEAYGRSFADIAAAVAIF